jgi:hypothetical protein
MEDLSPYCVFVFLEDGRFIEYEIWRFVVFVFLEAQQAGAHDDDDVPNHRKPKNPGKQRRRQRRL